MTQCCQSITEAQDNEMDALSIALIRMMRIAEQGYAALPTSVPPQASTPIIFGSDHEMIISLTRRELESFMSSLPSNLQATGTYFPVFCIAKKANIYFLNFSLNPATISSVSGSHL